MMAQQAKVVNDMQRSRSQVLQRTGQLRLGVRIELVTIIWMTIEASIAIVTGFATHSVSLQGFGIDSIIELISGGVLLWRLRVEQRGGTTGVVERAERRAAWITAISLFALAVYIVGDSAFAFLTRSHPEASWWGIGRLSRQQLSCRSSGGASYALPDASKVPPSKPMLCVALPAPTWPLPCWSAFYSTNFSAGGGPIPWLRSLSSTSSLKRAERLCMKRALVRRAVAVRRSVLKQKLLASI